MTEIGAALAAHLAGRATTLCHCWRLTRSDGTVFGFTDHDRRLTCQGTQFEPETGLTASEARTSLGLAVDTVDVEGALSAVDIREEDIMSGLYDGATVETFLVNWQDTAAFAHLRTAVIGKLTRRDGGFLAELESQTWALDQPNGKTIRRQCDAELGDTRCGFALQDSQFIASGTVAHAEAGDILTVDGLDAFAGGWFANGILTWTSGPATGRKERVTGHVKTASGTRLSVWREGPLPVQEDDAFTIIAGCDKQFSTCKIKFANGYNFRGFPHMPGNDAAYGYVSDDGVFDGGALVT